MKRILSVLLALLLTACALNTRITNTWRDADYSGGRFQRVLVMGFGDDGAGRRVFEDQFVRRLEATGVRAIASYTLVSGLSEANIPQVRAAVEKSGADSVLTTRLVSVDKRINAQPMFVSGAGYRRGFYGYYSSAMMVPAAYSYDVVTLETNLWQVIGDHLIWSGTTESFAPDNAREASATFADVIVEALRAQGLL